MQPVHLHETMNVDQGTVFLGLIVFLFIALLEYAKRRFRHRAGRLSSALSPSLVADIPGPRGPAVLDALAGRHGQHEYICQMHETYGDIFAMSWPDEDSERVFVRNPVHVRALLTNKVFSRRDATEWASTARVIPVSNLLRPLPSNNFLQWTDHNPKWRRQQA